ncbi:arsenate reductase/protein-tyrosine-phosphatase family protein [Micromonospora yangpuensis]|uniref:Protein-tyrosine phosphatase n=1 Tax=Micromonospora yangpuensis TaxID=683228 RepID=A0A1C6UR22_9ACTN|nr:low molecular weight phosphatase family protein [Micromonospora yangpuensis]GGM07410.1 protein-tyrosine-phosphatase [Micromonospora yangpuensis]SCL56390.1 protein-tyrosine phosphatase [Micromonospora yangpuensis]
MVDRILFVCHANLCRSPMAEYLAADLLAKLPVAVASAGTHAVEGRPMHPYAAEVAAGTGAVPADFRSRRVAPGQLLDAALVLTATRNQRSACVALAPAALHRVFTLRQFARLAELAPRPEAATGQPLRAAVRAAAQARGRLQPAAPADDDLADPLGGPLADFRQCARVIERCVLPVAALIEAAG